MKGYSLEEILVLAERINALSKKLESIYSEMLDDDEIVNFLTAQDLGEDEVKEELQRLSGEFMNISNNFFCLADFIRSRITDGIKAVNIS